MIDENIREQLYNEVAPAISRYSKAFSQGRGLEEDLEIVGLTACWKKLEIFNPSIINSNPLLWCKKAAKNAVMKYRRLNLPLSYSAYHTIDKIREKEEELKKEGITHQEEVLEALGLTHQEYASITTSLLILNPTSIDKKISLDESEVSLADVIPDRKTDTSQLKNTLLKFLDRLSPQEQLYIVLYDLYGFNLEEVAEIDSTKSTIQMVSQSRKKGLEKLRKELYIETYGRHAYEDANPTADSRILGLLLE